MKINTYPGSSYYQFMQDTKGLRFFDFITGRPVMKSLIFLKYRGREIEIDRIIAGVSGEYYTLRNPQTCEV